MRKRWNLAMEMHLAPFQMRYLTRSCRCFPLKRAASTSVLSKRWRNLFALMISSQDHLEFDDSDVLYPNEGNNRDHVQDSFRAFVDSTLLSLQQDGNCNKPLNKLSLKCQDDFDHFMSHTNRWISNALERGVSDLDLRITMPLINDDYRKLHRFFLPRILFTSNTLVKLTLGTRICIGDEPFGKICLPLLKSLFLYTVWFAHNDVTDFIIYSCPVLEELYVQHSYVDHPWWAGPEDFCHPNVKRITLHLDNYHARPPSHLSHRLRFNTPNLVYLDYADAVSDLFEYYCPDLIDSLVEARLDISMPYKFHPIDFEDKLIFISWICNVQILYLSSKTVKIMSQCFDYWRNGFPLFKNLAKLSFESRTKKGWKVLWTLVKNSPKLHTLILKRFQCVSDCGVGIDGNVVKVLELYGCRGNRREVQQVKRFLWECDFLQVMKLEFGPKVDDHKKLQLTKDILAFPRRSSKCQIHFL